MKNCLEGVSQFLWEPREPEAGDHQPASPAELAKGWEAAQDGPKAPRVCVGCPFLK